MFLVVTSWSAAGTHHGSVLVFAQKNCPAKHRITSVGNFFQDILLQPFLRTLSTKHPEWHILRVLSHYTGNTTEVVLSPCFPVVETLRTRVKNVST